MRYPLYKRLRVSFFLSLHRPALSFGLVYTNIALLMICKFNNYATIVLYCRKGFFSNEIKSMYNKNEHSHQQQTA